MTDSEAPQNTAALVINQAFQQAAISHRAGQLQDAEALYQAILQLQPGHPEANYNLGVLTVQMGQPAVALPYFIVALEADPTQRQYWLGYIDTLFQTGQLETARQVLARAKLQGLQGDDADALENKLTHKSAENLSEIEPPQISNESSPVSFADSQFSNSKPETQSIKLNSNAGMSAQSKKKSPDPQETNRLIALFTAGQYAEAAILAQSMTERFPKHGFGWKLLGGAYQQMGRSLEALEPMKKAVVLLPNDAAVHSNLGVALNDLGRMDEAVTSYRRALKIQPNYTIALNNMSNTLHKLGRLSEAEAGYRRALRINPVYAEAHCNLGVTLQGLNRLDEAAASYRRALEIKPDFIEAHSNLGKVLQDSERLDEAEASYRHALQIKPDYAEAHSNLGVTLQGLGRLGEAEASYRRALEIKPAYAEAHSNLGVALQGLGRLAEAEASYRRALEIKPAYAEAHCNLGVALQGLGRLAEAEASYRHALQIKPQYADALLSLGHLLCYLDDFVQAADVYQKTLAADSATKGLEASVNLAILCYLNMDYAQCRSNLLASQQVMASTDSKNLNHRIYWLYLDKLLSLQQQSNLQDKIMQDMGTLHVIGDSHALAAQGVVVRYNGLRMIGVTEWITGCKQWHLGNSRPNKYKHKLEAVMARLPRGSTILLSVGEIDCRSDEGILKAWQKYPEKSLNDVVQSTVDRYLNYIAAITARHDHRVIVGGVPCSSNVRLGNLAPELSEHLVHLIRIFNDALKSQSLAAGMDFLDVYTLTDRGDGIAGEGWHIDSTHLLPDTLVAAFDRHCLHHPA